MMTTEPIATITRKNPVRNDFAAVSSGNNYFGTKGNAVNAFDSVLQDYDLHFDRNELTNFNGDEGRAVLSIVNDFEHHVGYAHLSWYRLSSGRYEVIGYIG